jgi:hypothetical protein
MMLMFLDLTNLTRLFNVDGHRVFADPTGNLLYLTPDDDEAQLSNLKSTVGLKYIEPRDFKPSGKGEEHDRQRQHRITIQPDGTCWMMIMTHNGCGASGEEVEIPAEMAVRMSEYLGQSIVPDTGTPRVTEGAPRLQHSVGVPEYVERSSGYIVDRQRAVLELADHTTLAGIPFAEAKGRLIKSLEDSIKDVDAHLKSLKLRLSEVRASIPFDLE